MRLGLALAAGTAGGLYGALPGGDDLLLLAQRAPCCGARPRCRDAEPADQPPAPSPHAWPIALAGLVVVGLTVLGWLVLASANVAAMVSWPTPDAGFVLLVVEGLLRLALPVAALVAVVLAVRRAAPAREAAERLRRCRRRNPRCRP